MEIKYWWRIHASLDGKGVIKLPHPVVAHVLRKYSIGGVHIPAPRVRRSGAPTHLDL